MQLEQRLARRGSATSLPAVESVTAPPSSRGRRRARPGSPGSPRACRGRGSAPKSSTWIVAQTRITSCTSCSTSRIAMPSSASSSSRSAKRVRLALVEARGGLVEQQHLRAGWPAPGRARRGGRARSAWRRPARRPRPGCRRGRAGAPPRRGRLTARSRDHERRISAAVRMFSRAVSEPNTSRRWNVRAMPAPGPDVGLGAGDVLAVEAGPGRCTVSCRPVMTLNSVVLPAPFGPIRPVIEPGLDVEVDVVHGDVPAEAHGGAPHLEQRPVQLPSCRCVPPGLSPVSSSPTGWLGQASARGAAATGSPHRG